LALLTATGVGAGCTVRSQHAFDWGGRAAPPPEPELVQPGVVSTAAEENFPAVDPVDGSLWFSSYTGERFARQTLMRAPRQGDGWGAPAPVLQEPGDAWGARAPRFSADGRRLFVTSGRGIGGAPGGDVNLWVYDREGAGWGAPRPLPDPVRSPRPDMHASIARDGTLYFASRRDGGAGAADVYRATPRADGSWESPERLPAPVNDARSQPDLLVAPDGSWMILVITNPPPGPGDDDLFVSRLARGRWSVPERLPAPINSAAYEYGPSLSPDGTTLYFNSARRGTADIYRVPLRALGLRAGR
jgi:Tol biopolymer transport system component